MVWGAVAVWEDQWQRPPQERGVPGDHETTHMTTRRPETDDAYLRELLVRFGENVKAARRSKKMTQADLAGMAGMNRSHLAELETGVYFGVQLRTACRLAIALDVDIGLLLKLPREKKSDEGAER